MIKYQCDKCGQIVGPNETLTASQHFSYVDGSGVALAITLTQACGFEHVCYACMWRILDDMMETMAPEELKLKWGPVNDGPSTSSESDIELPVVPAGGVVPEPRTDSLTNPPC